MCPGHLGVDGTLTQDSVMQLSNRTQNRIVSYQDLTQYLGQCVHNSFQQYSDVLYDSKPRINVLNSDSDCICYTGLNLANFNDLCSQIRIAGMHEHTKVQAIALLLGKLRLGNSQNQLGHFFGYSQSQVSKLIDKAGYALETQFAPNYLGYYDHITREQYIQNHQKSMIRILHEILPGSAGVILDGTYFEIEKSSNYNIQKGTFNLHKHYNLVKFMVVCAPDGYILDTFGPTGSDYSHNDAAIFNSMLADVNGFRRFFHPNDIVVVDRGFRDSVQTCNQLGLRIAMPPILRGRKQLTRQEADHSRFVTKVRWVVESVNGRIKNVFAFFRHQIPNLYINNLGRFLKIVCALFNKYFCAIYPDREDQIQVAQYMVQRSREANDFQRRVVAFGLDKFTNKYVRTTADLIQGFPQLTEQDLRDITVGIYQIGESPSYTAYHLTRTGHDQNDVVEYEIYAHQDFYDVLLVRMQSRHVQNKVHNAILAFQRGQNGINAIKGYYCSCYVGKRFVGMCCHTAAVLWLLSYSLPNDAYRAPAANIANGLIDFRNPN